MSEIFIIGAPRSGTNILRDCLASFDGIVTWPCDELNYLWRHGNLYSENDRFTEDNVNKKNRKVIKRFFEDLKKKSADKIVLEKTCANSLRIPFVLELFPNAKFVFLVREGSDASLSAYKRINGEILGLVYFLKKLKYVPLSDAPFYVFKLLQGLVRKGNFRSHKFKPWGPIYENMMKDYALGGPREVAFNQWYSCVNTAFQDIKNLGIVNCVHFIRYEDFVRNPERELKGVLKFIDPLLLSSKQLPVISGLVNSESVRKSKDSNNWLSPNQKIKAERIINELNSFFTKRND